MEGINKSVNTASKITILSEQNIKNHEEIIMLDKETIKKVLERIIDQKKPREILITCTTDNKSSANELIKILTNENGYSCKLSNRGKDVLIIDGSKILLVSELEKELTALYQITKRHFCELDNWRVEVDKKD